jgi:hypothetical protein
MAITNSPVTTTANATKESDCLTNLTGPCTDVLCVGGDRAAGEAAIA